MREGERAERWRYRRAPRRMRADADSARVRRPPEEGSWQMCAWRVSLERPRVWWVVMHCGSGQAMAEATEKWVAARMSGAHSMRSRIASWISLTRRESGWRSKVGRRATHVNPVVTFNDDGDEV
jgi:hypothetical protein